MIEKGISYEGISYGVITSEENMKKRAIIFVFTSCIMFLINGLFASSLKTTDPWEQLVGDWRTKFGEAGMRISIKDGKPIIKAWSRISGDPVEVSNYSGDGKTFMFTTYYAKTNYRNHYRVHLADKNTLKGQSTGSFTAKSEWIRITDKISKAVPQHRRRIFGSNKPKNESCYKQILTNKTLKQRYEIFVCYSTVIFSRLKSGKSVTILPMYIKNHIDSRPLHWMDFKILIQTTSEEQVKNITLTAKEGNLACNYVVQPGEIHVQQLYFYPFMRNKIQKISLVYPGNHQINLVYRKDCGNIISEYNKPYIKPEKILKILVNSKNYPKQAKIDFSLCASNILKYAGFEVMDNPLNSHAQLEINAKLNAIRYVIDRKHIDLDLVKETYTYSGAKVSGHLRFSEQNKQSVTREFRGKVELKKNHNARNASGAPFFYALIQKDSFVHQLIQLLSEQYGPEFLVRALDEKNRYRHFVFEEIQKSKTDTISKMITLLKTGDISLKRGIVDAMGKLKDKRVVDTLISMLEADDPHLKSGIINTLGKLKDKRAVDPLLSILGMKDYFLKPKVIMALGELGDQKALSFLLDLLKSKDDRLRNAAILALSNIPSDMSVTPLIAFLKDSNKNTRVCAVSVLGELGNARAVKPLTEVLNDPYAYIRKEAALALTKLGWKPENQGEEILYLIALRKWKKLEEKGIPAIEPLIKTMGDKDYQVRTKAEDVLEILGKKAFPKLIEAVRNSNPNIRQGAIRLLSDIKSASTIEPIISALDDKNEYVRDRAFAALGKKKDPRIVDALVPLLKNHEYRNRKLAARTLDKLKWKPKNEEQKIDFLIAKEDIKSCLNLGRKAIDPLIHALLEYKIPKKLQSEIGVGLSIMLGNKFYSDKSKWKKWWEQKHNSGDGQKKGCFSTFWTIHVHAVFKGKMGSIFVTPNKQAPSPSESNGWEDSVTYNLQVYGKVKRVKISVTLTVAGGDGIKRKDIIYIDGEEKLNFSNTFNQSCMNFGGSKKYEVLRNRSGTHPIKITHKIQLTKNGQPVSIGATQLESKVSIPIFRQVK